MRKSKVSFFYSVNSDVIEIRVKSNGRVIDKYVCPTNDKQEFKNMIHRLQKYTDFDIKQLLNSIDDGKWW